MDGSTPPNSEVWNNMSSKDKKIKDLEAENQGKASFGLKSGIEPLK